MPGLVGPRWTRVQDKPLDLGSAMRSLLIYMGRDRSSLYLGMVCAIIATILSLVGPQYLAEITDTISVSVAGPGTDGHGPDRQARGLAVPHIPGKLRAVVGEEPPIAATLKRVGNGMRKDLSRKLDRLSISYLESHSIDDILSRMINDTDVVRTGSTERFSTTVVVVYTIAGSLIMMPYTEWRLVVVTVIPTLAGFAVMFTVTRRFQK